MNKKCLDWLLAQIRNSQIRLAHAESRNDTSAAVNIREQIEIMEHLVKLVPKEE